MWFPSEPQRRPDEGAAREQGEHTCTKLYGIGFCSFIITGPAAQECTVGNIVRSTLIVVVIVALGVVLAIEWKKWPRLRTR